MNQKMIGSHTSTESLQETSRKAMKGRGFGMRNKWKRATAFVCSFMMLFSDVASLSTFSRPSTGAAASEVAYSESVQSEGTTAAAVLEEPVSSGIVLEDPFTEEPVFENEPEENAPQIVAVTEEETADAQQEPASEETPQTENVSSHASAPAETQETVYVRQEPTETFVSGEEYVIPMVSQPEEDRTVTVIDNPTDTQAEKVTIAVDDEAVTVNLSQVVRLTVPGDDMVVITANANVSLRIEGSSDIYDPTDRRLTAAVHLSAGTYTLNFFPVDGGISSFKVRAVSLERFTSSGALAEKQEETEYEETEDPENITKEGQIKEGNETKNTKETEVGEKNSNISETDEQNKGDDAASLSLNEPDVTRTAGNSDSRLAGQDNSGNKDGLNPEGTGKSENEEGSKETPENENINEDANAEKAESTDGSTDVNALMTVAATAEGTWATVNADVSASGEPQQGTNAQMNEEAQQGTNVQMNEEPKQETGEPDESAELLDETLTEETDESLGTKIRAGIEEITAPDLENIISIIHPESPDQDVIQEETENEILHSVTTAGHAVYRITVDTDDPAAEHEISVALPAPIRLVGEDYPNTAELTSYQIKLYRAGVEGDSSMSESLMIYSISGNEIRSIRLSAPGDARYVLTWNAAFTYAETVMEQVLEAEKEQEQEEEDQPSEEIPEQVGLKSTRQTRGLKALLGAASEGDDGEEKSGESGENEGGQTENGSETSGDEPIQTGSLAITNVFTINEKELSSATNNQKALLNDLETTFTIKKEDATIGTAKFTFGSDGTAESAIWTAVQSDIGASASEPSSEAGSGNGEGGSSPSDTVPGENDNTGNIQTPAGDNGDGEGTPASAQDTSITGAFDSASQTLTIQNLMAGVYTVEENAKINGISVSQSQTANVSGGEGATQTSVTFTNNLNTGSITVDLSCIEDGNSQTKAFNVALFTKTDSDSDDITKNGNYMSVTSGTPDTFENLLAGTYYVFEVTGDENSVSPITDNKYGDFTVIGNGTEVTIGGNIPAEKQYVSLINVKNTERYSMAVTVYWDDNHNQLGVRPSTLYARLMKSTANSNNQTPVGTYTLTPGASGNEWTYLVPDLPVKDENGQPITYTWYELISNNDDDAPLGTGSVIQLNSQRYFISSNGVQTAENGKTLVTKLTNRLIKTDAIIPIKKEINVEEGTTYTGDESFIIKLNSGSTNPTPITGNVSTISSDTVSLKKEGTDSFHISGYTQEGTYTYTIQEEKGNTPGMTYDTTGKDVTVQVTYDNSAHQLTAIVKQGDEIISDDQPLKITNKYALTNINITKKWEDNNNQDGIRPTVDQWIRNITLKGDGEAVTGVSPELDANSNTNEYSATYNGLAKYQADGTTLIAYTVIEELIAGYSSSNDNTTASSSEGTIYQADSQGIISIINTHIPNTVTITASREWAEEESFTALRQNVLYTLNGKYTDTNGEVQNLTISEYKNAQNESQNEVQTIAVDSTNPGAVTWVNLPEFVNGKKVTYTVTASSLDHYSQTEGNLAFSEPVNNVVTGSTSFTYRMNKGTLVIDKTFAFDREAIDLNDLTQEEKDVLKFTVSRTVDESEYYVSISDSGRDGQLKSKDFKFTYKDFVDGSLVIENLPVGQYTIKETGAGDFLTDYGYELSEVTGENGTLTPDNKEYSRNADISKNAITRTHFTNH